MLIVNFDSERNPYIQGINTLFSSRFVRKKYETFYRAKVISLNY